MSVTAVDIARQVYMIRSADGRCIGTSNIGPAEFRALHREVLALLIRREVPRED